MLPTCLKTNKDLNGSSKLHSLSRRIHNIRFDKNRKDYLLGRFKGNSSGNRNKLTVLQTSLNNVPRRVELFEQSLPVKRKNYSFSFFEVMIQSKYILKNLKIQKKFNDDLIYLHLLKRPKQYKQRT
jgi:hypothetical protein